MICNEAHGLKRNGSYFIENVGLMENVTLVFENPKYKPIIIDVLEFKSRLDERYSKPNDDRTKDVENWFLTQGRRKDCVYYVDPTKTWRECKLIEELCDLTW